MSTNRYIDKIKARLAKEAGKRMQLQALLDDQVARNRAILAERYRLKEALAAMLEIHGVTQRYADTHIEIPQSWVEVSDLARAALQGEQP
ncbi:hypothetical protein EGJ12_08290 [Stutzerimonas stutzeri]|uniref:hypothetical protein n=1 Tax=Stutzerimonas stutzeri TaxID=316 RepID=UPI000F765E3D|nr:hypothetical protein [Stutzerimonas stutzeri]RRV38660.1 hypothetical protein EGJ12_07940 [Stutzerimonas stutzeri]RRV38723.1 hypothetical protein EGJ12_08290 [Stutzerimonas stutzeri]